MKSFQLIALAAVVAGSLSVVQAAAAEVDSSRNQVQGQKIDSGLGDLPHYRHWADKSGKNVVTSRVAGEKLDSGLGDIVPYSLGQSGLPKGVDVAQRK